MPSDDFNRADESPLAGNWTRVGTNNFNLVSNRVRGTIGVAAAHAVYWNADSFAADQWSKCQIYAGDANRTMGVAARVQDQSATAVNCYCLNYVSGRAKIWRIIDNVYNELGAYEYAYADGDELELQCEGTALRGYVNGTLRISVTDSTFSSGAAGLHVWGGNNFMDNWSAGNLGAGHNPIPLLHHHRRRRR
jgi:hypothetical protein